MHPGTGHKPIGFFFFGGGGEFQGQRSRSPSSKFPFFSKMSGNHHNILNFGCRDLIKHPQNIKKHEHQFININPNIFYFCQVRVLGTRPSFSLFVSYKIRASNLGNTLPLPKFLLATGPVQFQ